MIDISPAPIDAAQRFAAFERRITGAGAIVAFTGLVRARNAEETIVSLFLQAHPVLTRRGLDEALADACRKWPLLDHEIGHRVGTIAPNETIVFVATAAVHRRAAFAAADFLMDYLKTQAIFWKKEVTSRGACWIEPRPEDYDDHGRWN